MQFNSWIGSHAERLLGFLAFILAGVCGIFNWWNGSGGWRRCRSYAGRLRSSVDAVLQRQGASTYLFFQSSDVKVLYFSNRVSWNLSSDLYLPKEVTYWDEDTNLFSHPACWHTRLSWTERSATSFRSDVSMRELETWIQARCVSSTCWQLDCPERYHVEIRWSLRLTSSLISIKQHRQGSAISLYGQQASSHLTNHWWSPVDLRVRLPLPPIMCLRLGVLHLIYYRMSSTL